MKQKDNVRYLAMEVVMIFIPQIFFILLFAVIVVSFIIVIFHFAKAITRLIFCLLKEADEVFYGRDIWNP
jgi:hypothetical protein